MTCKEITTMYADGEMSKGDALSKLTDVAATEGVERTLHSLPNSWSAEVERWIFEVYDNDIDSDNFLSFGDPEPDLEQRRKDIGVLRAWIAARKASDAQRHTTPTE